MLVERRPELTEDDGWVMSGLQGVIFVAAGGNDGPALSTAGAPACMTHSIICTVAGGTRRVVRKHPN